MVYSLDALFGLPRKKSAGESFRSPLHGDLFFCDQTEVDEFVINASCGQKDDFKVILFAGMQILNCKYVFKAILACMFSCKF